MRTDGGRAERQPSPFGQLVREFRIAAGLSQEALAERAQLSVAGVSVLERGLRRAPRRETVALLAAGLGLSAQDCARLETSAALAPRSPEPRLAHDSTTGDPKPHAPAYDLVAAPRTTSTSAEKWRSDESLCSRCRAFGPRTGESARRDVQIGYVDLPDIPLSELLAATLANLPRGSETGPNAPPIVQSIDKRLLTALDNTEHLLGAAAFIAQQILDRLTQRARTRDES